MTPDNYISVRIASSDQVESVVSAPFKASKDAFLTYIKWAACKPTISALQAAHCRYASRPLSACKAPT